MHLGFWKVSMVVVFLVMAAAMPVSSPRNENIVNDEVVEHRFSGPSPSGDWVISNETTLTGEVFDIYGRVFIVAGGHLTLSNCDITMHSQTDWWPNEDLCYFNVAKGGTLTLKNTHIHPGTNYRWYVTADGGSRVDIQGCTLEGNYPRPSHAEMAHQILKLGGWPTYAPLDEAIVKDNIINGFEGGGILVHADSAEVSGNYVTNVYGTGIYVYGAPNGNITHNTISDVESDTDLNTGMMWGGTGMVLRNCEDVAVSHNAIINPALRGFSWRIASYTYTPFCSGLREFEGNTVDGDPILFVQDESDVVVGSSVDEAIIHNCKNVTVDGFSGISLAISYSDDVTIRNSEFTECPFELCYLDNLLIEDNEFQDIPFGDPIAVPRCSNVLIRNNRVNRTYGWSWGIHPRWSSDVVIENNIVSDQGRWGIAVLDCEEVTISENEVYKSGTAGVVAWRATGIEISGNKIHNITLDGFSFCGGPYAGPYTGYCGIDVASCDGVIISGNTITDSLGDGIWVDVSNDAIIQGNTIHNAMGRGMSIATSLRTRVEDNYIANATWMGLNLLQCANASVSDIVLESIKGRAVYWHNKYVSQRITKFENVTLDGEQILLYQDNESLSIEGATAGAILINCSYSRIEGLDGNFISISHSNNVVVRECTISGGGAGLSYCANATIACCSISDTPFENVTVHNGYIWYGILGIDIYSSENALIINNRLNNTGRGAIDVFHSIPARIIGNEILNSGLDAIYLWMTREATIAGNYVNNTWGRSICLEQTSRSSIYLNYFGVAGNRSVGIIDSSQLHWDDGSHGNYYFEYDGVDDNGDGIGDTPFELNHDNTDQYPLVDISLVHDHVSDCFEQGPEIVNVNIEPEVLVSMGTATFLVQTNASYSTFRVILSYSLDGGTTWNNITMRCLEGIWTATIEEVPAGVLQYRIYVMDSLGNTFTGGIEEVAVSAIDLVALSIIGGIAVVAVLAVVVVVRKRRV